MDGQIGGHQKRLVGVGRGGDNLGTGDAAGRTEDEGHGLGRRRDGESCVLTICSCPKKIIIKNPLTTAITKRMI